MMSRSFLICWCWCVVFIMGCARSASRPVKQYTIEQFMNTTRISGSSFSPDEKHILFSSNKTGIFNAYTLTAILRMKACCNPQIEKAGSGNDALAARNSA